MDLQPSSGWTFTMPLSSVFLPGGVLVLPLRLRDFRLGDRDEGREVEVIGATESQLIAGLGKGEDAMRSHAQGTVGICGLAVRSHNSHSSNNGD